MSEEPSDQKLKTAYSCSPAALKQFVQAKQEAPCTNPGCKAERDHFNETFTKIARAFAQIHGLADSADRTVAQAAASVQRITQEFDVPLVLPVRNTKAEQATKNTLNAIAEKIRKTYAPEPRPGGALIAGRKRLQAGLKDPPMRSSAAGPSYGSRDKQKCVVVLSDDDDKPPAPPPARSDSTRFMNTVSLQGTSSTPAAAAPVKASRSGQRKLSPMLSNSAGSSPPSLGSEQDDMDVEAVDEQPRTVVQFNLVRKGVDRSLPLYTLGPGARRIYATQDLLERLCRYAAHPLDFPPSEAHRSIPLSLHSISAETTVLGPERYQVELVFDGLKTSQKVALYYYLKSVADASEDAEWQQHDELGPCMDGKPRTRFELQFDHVETGEMVMFSCRVELNGLMGPFSVPFAVNLSRPTNGTSSIVKVRALQWRDLPPPEVVDLD